MDLHCLGTFVRTFSGCRSSASCPAAPTPMGDWGAAFLDPAGFSFTGPPSGGVAPAELTGGTDSDAGLGGGVLGPAGFSFTRPAFLRCRSWRADRRHHAAGGLGGRRIGPCRVFLHSGHNRRDLLCSYLYAIRKRRAGNQVGVKQRGTVGVCICLADVCRKKVECCGGYRAGSGVDPQPITSIEAAASES